MSRSLTVLALAGMLGGCASSLSGLGGTESYGCKAPDGVQCTSVSGVYANTRAGEHRAPTPDKLGPAQYGASSLAAASAIPSPLRSAPRVLRLWIAPWEDRDGDLHEESVVNVVVDPGRWLIEHVRPRPRDSFATVPVPIAPDAATAAHPVRAPSPDRTPTESR